MYVVLEGRIMISKYIPGAGEEALAFLERGDYFGEMALIENQPRSADAKSDGGCERQDQDQPRGMRRRRWAVWGFHGMLRQGGIVTGSAAIAQVRGGNAVLPIAQRRSSNPRATILVVMAGTSPAMTRRMRNEPWRPINCCFSPATASAPK